MAGIALSVLAGCSRNINTTEAVRQGVIQHLAKQSSVDLKAVDVEVSSVAFREGEAEAVVLFRPKSAPGSADSMQMKYILQRQGNQWVVKSKSGVPGDPHGKAMEGSPGAHGLPPGHPDAGAIPSTPQMPPGHPQVDSGKAKGNSNSATAGK